MIDGAVVRNAAEIARREEITRARVCQLMRLLKLAPEVLSDLENVEGTGPVPSEARLRKLAGMKTPERQVAEYERLCAVERTSTTPASRLRQSGRPPERGFQPLFDRARRYHAMLESGEARSLEAIGRGEGVTGVRIGQIMALLHLAPAIIDLVDVPVGEMSVRVSERQLRQVAKVRNHEEQLRAWACMA
jgi:hypothetical protein